MSEQIEKSYVVQDDVEIAGSGFSGASFEEKRILKELDQLSKKKQLVAMVLCLIAGGQYYYVGRFRRGLLYTLTGGFLLIGSAIDFFIIASGRFKDKDGRFLNDPQRFKLELELDALYEAKAQGKI